jgi:hypothetical protein
MKTEAQLIAVPENEGSKASGLTLNNAGWLVLGWGVAIGVASATGLLDRLPAMAIGALIMGWFAFGAVAYFGSSNLRNAAGRVGIRSVTGFHVWRIAAALLFFWYGAHGLLPALFVQRAAWGDLIAGLIAGAVWLWPTRAGYWITHLFGLLDLVIATATGMSLRLNGPVEMRNVASFPVALIPLFAVGLTATMHLVAFDLLLRKRVVIAAD